MTSLWQLTSPIIETDDWLELKMRADVIVVGAGLTGLVTAVLLARSGLQVTVIEAHTVGGLTTGNTTGKLSLLQGSTFSEVKQYAGESALNAYCEANREGQAWLLRQLEVYDSQVDRRPAFTYVAAQTGGTDRHLATLDAEEQALGLAGIQVERVTQVDELPIPLVAALRLADQAQLQPMRVLAGLARELRERGGKIVEHTRVQGIETHRLEVNSCSVTVVTSRGLLHTERCVLATGFPILDRGLFFAKLNASRSYAIAFRLLESTTPRGMYVALDSDGHSLRSAWAPEGDEVLVVGGGSHITGRSSHTSRKLDEIETWTRRHFGAVGLVTWWGAQDYSTHWKLPFAGSMPRSGDRLFTASGYNKWGMTNAVAAGLTIAADMLGGNLEWAKVLRSHALRLSAVKEAFGANAEVGRRLVGGWAQSEFIAADVAVAEQTLIEGQGVVAREGGRPVAISRVDDQVCRLSAVCTHMGGIVRWNSAERSWDCPLHASRFSATGARLEGPAVRDLVPADEGNGKGDDPDPVSGVPDPSPAS